MIVIIDYNVGNIKSVCNAFRHIGCDVTLSCERRAIEDAYGLVLPGVAAFGYAVDAFYLDAKFIRRREGPYLRLTYEPPFRYAVDSDTLNPSLSVIYWLISQQDSSG